MSGKINPKISEILRQDDLEQITNYMVEVCRLLVSDFTSQGRKLPNNENQIRSIMLEEFLDDDEVRKIHGMSDYRFYPETQEHYDGMGNYVGRADIRIQLITDFNKHSAYYLAECKRIDGSDDLNKKYVENGIARFVTQKYSSYYGKNIMLGFVVERISISSNAKKIEKIQNCSADPHMHGNFDIVQTGTDHEMYKCLYRIQAGELELRHIFCDVSDLID